MPKRISRGRGRPRGGYCSYADIRLLEYLAVISVKYGIDSDDFFDSFIEAWKHQESTCGSLSIECRKRTRDNAVFLITNSFRVIAQFPIPKHILEETSPLKEFAYIIEREKSALMKKRNDSGARYFKIKDLKPGMKRISLKACVLAISRPQIALTRYNDYVKFTNVTLTDETGTVRLTLWNGRMNSLSITDMVEIENANVAAYRGETQLRIGRQSRLRVIEKGRGTLTKGVEQN